MSVSRWCKPGQIGESHRLVGLAAQALRNYGVSKPRKHLLVQKGGDLCTLLVSKNPFSNPDLTGLYQAGDRYGFNLVLDPIENRDRLMTLAAESENWFYLEQFSGIDLSPPTDNRPFFFSTFRFSNFFNKDRKKVQGIDRQDRQAILILIILVCVVSVLVVLFLGVSILFFKTPHKNSLPAKSFLAISYFAMIGLAFILFESAQLQRLNIFLGYPIYSLTVVLFSLLLSSALGSYCSENPRPLRFIALP